MSGLPRLEGAACSGRADLFLVSRLSQTKLEERAAICGRCPVRPECLAWALNHEVFGFWGGHTAPELKALRTKYGIALRPVLNHSTNH